MTIFSSDDSESISKILAYTSTGTVTEYPDLYDLTFPERADELQFYLERSNLVEEILELGVGTGRIALPLARQGRKVVGVENSSAMVSYMQERVARESQEVRARISVVQQDARTYAPGKTFKSVFAPFMMFNYLLTTDDQLLFMRNISAILARQGTAVLELMTPATLPELYLNDGIRRTVLQKNDDGADQRILEVQRTVRYDASIQVVEQDRYYRFFQDGLLVQEKCVTWRNRLCSLGEVDLLLRCSGLKLLNTYGDHRSAKFCHESKFLIVEISHAA